MLVHEFPKHDRDGPCRGVVFPHGLFHRVRLELVENLIAIETTLWPHS